MLLKGSIENIIYRNENNGWTVLLVNSGKAVFTFVGNVANVNVGEYIEAEVEETEHPHYGLQYKIISYKSSIPNDDLDAIYKFLVSIKVKGIGEATISRIIDEFDLETIDIIKDNSELLSRVKGMTFEKIDRLREKVISRINEIDIIIALEKYNLKTSIITRIIEEYGDNTLKVINESPYNLALDIEGIGFNTCDKIAKMNGIETNSEKRIEAGIIYLLETEYANGNVYVEKDELLKNAVEILSLEEDYNFEDVLYNLGINMLIKVDKMNDVTMVFLKKAYNTEKKLSELLYSKKDNITIITGGPGTGKTYNIKKYLGDAVSDGLQFAICAPTGRAAKRIKEVTGFEAKTIHRLLECVGDKEGKGHKAYFNVNSENKLDIDLLIVDEMSMVDEYLMYALIQAVPDGAAIILVGDVDQLPSVGAGQVLKDMIASDLFEVKRLTEIHRQEEGSNIVVNAHLVNDGENINLKDKTEDFIFLHKNNEDSIKEAIKILISKNLPNHFNVGLDQIQVICPSKIGNLGVETINTILQNELNAESYDKLELKIGDRVFRMGDKVMQTSNNYNLPFDVVDDSGKVCDAGVGIYNGDIGEIVDIDEEENTMIIKYDDRLAYYAKEDLKDLNLAYAITVHKSQGSEYDIVIMPMTKAPYRLLTRKILYTAMTRAKKCLIFIGSENYFYEMVNNHFENKRNSALCSKLYLYDI